MDAWQPPDSRSALCRDTGLGASTESYWGIAFTTFSIGLLSFQRGDLDRAEAFERESLDARWALRDKRTIADSLGVLACIAHARGQVDQAALLFGAAASLREATGASLLQWLRPVQEQTIAAARASLGDETFDVAWTEGRRMPLERIIAMLEGSSP